MKFAKYDNKDNFIIKVSKDEIKDLYSVLDDMQVSILNHDGLITSQIFLNFFEGLRNLQEV